MLLQARAGPVISEPSQSAKMSKRSVPRFRQTRGTSSPPIGAASKSTQWLIHSYAERRSALGRRV